MTSGNKSQASRCLNAGNKLHSIIYHHLISSGSQELWLSNYFDVTLLWVDEAYPLFDSIIYLGKLPLTPGMFKHFHKGPVWLQVFFSTKQQHTRPESFNQLISVFRKMIGQTVCSWLVGTKTCSHTGPLWNSLDMPALHLQCESVASNSSVGKEELVFSSVCKCE